VQQAGPQLLAEIGNGRLGAAEIDCVVRALAQLAVDANLDAPLLPELPQPLDELPPSYGVKSSDMNVRKARRRLDGPPCCVSRIGIWNVEFNSVG
jgi:hypothetical protein